jgi:hypothetical protein
MGIEKTLTHTPSSIFTSGATIYYRVTAKNGVGYGTPSAATSVLCD